MKLFSELVDIPQLQGLLNSLYEVTGVASNIVDNDLTILAKTGWMDICAHFHRNHPDTEAKCHSSAKKIFDNLHKDPYIAYKCLNGLYDCACPIMVNGESIAILFVAQFLLEPPDIELFRVQAACYGFEEKAYLEALGNVPVLTEEKLVKFMRLYSDLASVLADLGLRRLKQIEAFDELQKRESALRESEEKYRALVDNINVGVYRNTANSKDGFVQANPALARIFGYESKEEFMQISISAHYQNPDERELLVADAKRDGFIKSREVGFIKKDGTLIWCVLSTTVHYDAKGNIEWMGGIIEDITERKKAEEALQQAYNVLEFKVEERTQALAGANEELTAMNEELMAMNEELTAMNEEHIAMNEELLDANTGLNNEVIHRQRVEQKLKAAIEELRDMQTHLVQSEKMASLGSLVAGVAHEINTPVGVGVTASSYLKQLTEEFIELCKHGIPNREDLINYLENLQGSSDIIFKNLQRAGKLIKSFKQVSVDQSSEVQRVFNIKAYLDEIIFSMHPKLKKTSHQIRVECDDGLSINGFPGAFAQVITNLVMNSLSHAYRPEDKGNICIAVKKKNGVIMITYSDDGIGIESNTLDKIFDPFFTTKRGSGGTGLGLYIVYNIISQQFGGTIDCDSTPSKGTIFQICLPVL